MKLSKSIKADLALVAMTFIWGSMFTIVKQSLAQASPVLFVALRFSIAAVLTLCFMPGQVRKISGRTLFRGLLLSIVLLGAFIFQTIGLRSTSAAHSAFITSLCVLLVPFLGFLLFGSKLGGQTLAGVVLATVGLFLLLVNMEDLRVQPGDWLTLVCAALFALQIVLLGRFVASTEYRPLQLLQMAGAAVLGLLLAPALETPFIVWDSRLTFYLLFAGVLATALAFYVQASAQRLTTPNRAALIFSLEPFFAALFAYWVTGQVLTAKEWIGGILVLAGVLISELRYGSWRGRRLHSMLL